MKWWQLNCRSQILSQDGVGWIQPGSKLDRRVLLLTMERAGRLAAAGSKLMFDYLASGASPFADVADRRQIKGGLRPARH